jgi:CBS domain-containing protein
MGQQIRERREAEHAGVVPVNENGFLTGMVTDRDTATRVVAHREDTGATEVGDVTSAAAP